ncbi:MAG: hypothetical protein J6A61_05900 [Clostridia bacterium]|nr:hypothetical protein [Clostridia bacterium]
MVKEYSFGEQETEFSLEANKMIPVEKTPEYEMSKRKVLELLEKNKVLTENDFWILKKEAKDHSVIRYLNLVIKHTGCLKLNDKASAAQKFDPMSVSLDKSGYRDSLVYTYRNQEQGIFEVGEASRRNCKNGYPYATALKRLFDRVVLRIAKISFECIHSESEAMEDEFVELPTDEKAKDHSGEFEFPSAADAFKQVTGNESQCS